MQALDIIEQIEQFTDLVAEAQKKNNDGMLNRRV
tara:strand:+ start:248 stop:349 length:102 start_codon:yes stop_codon:yes gene_type:complete